MLATSMSLPAPTSISAVAPPSPPDRPPAPTRAAAHPFAELLRQNRQAAARTVPASAPAAATPKPASSSCDDEAAAATTDAGAKARAVGASAKPATAPATSKTADQADPDHDSRSDDADTSHADEADRAKPAHPHAPHGALVLQAPVEPGMTIDRAGVARLAGVPSQEASGVVADASASTAAPGAAASADRNGGSALAGVQDGKYDGAPGMSAPAVSALAAETRTRDAHSSSTAIDSAAAPSAPGSSAAPPLSSATLVAGASESTAAAQATVAAPLDSAGFAAAFGVQVSMLAKAGVQHAELHLNPAEMGPVSVQIAVHGNAARIDFGADLQTTRQAIEAGLPALAAALQEAGLTLSGGGVSQHAASGGGEQGGTAGAPGPAPRDGAARLDTMAAAVKRTVRAGGVDTYA